MKSGQLPAPSPDLLETIADCERRQEWYRTYLFEASGKNSDEALPLARFLVAAVEGGLLRARVARDSAPLRDLVSFLQSMADPE